MSLRALINKQTIIIDSHQRGNGHYDHWDDQAKDIHMDKRTTTKAKGKEVEAKLKIPLNSNRPVTCEVNKSPNEIASNRIKKEVREAFEKTKVRERFIRDLLDNLDRYPSNFDSKVKAAAAFRKIAEHFGLTKEMVQQMIFDGGERINGITIEYLAEDGNYYYITADQDKITLGQMPKASN